MLLSLPAPILFRLSTAALALAMPQVSWAEEAYGEVEAPTIVVEGHREEGYKADSANALKTGTPLLDTPQSVTTISRAQLDDQGIDQLNDALRYVPGVTLAQGEGHRDQITIRGQSTTADFYLDGVRDDAQYYRPLYNTERVEVLKGANALLFGRGGGGGVINRVTKAPVLGEDRLAMAVSGDSFGAWSVSGDANLALGDTVALRINETYEEFANHRDGYDGHFFGFAPTLGVKLGEATRLSLAYEYVEDSRVTDRGVPSFGGLPINGFDTTFFGDTAINRSDVTAHFARLRLDQELGEGLSFNVIGQYATYDKYYGNVLPGAVNAARTAVSLSGYRSSTTRDNWIGQANLVWNGNTGALKHTLLVGVEASDQSTASNRDDARFSGAASVSVPLALRITVPALGWAATSNSQSAVRSLSAYVQDQIEIGEHLQLIAGVRYDDFRIEATNLIGGAVTGRSDGKWSPRLGVVIKPQSNISLYASYAKSFLPQTGDQFTTLAANLQTLAPEEFRNLEAGAKWDVTPGLALTAAVFQLDRTNTRATDPVTGNPVLSGSSRVRGFEASLAGQITDNWQASLGYAHQTGEIRTTTTAAPAGRKLDKLPRDQVSLWTRYNVSSSIGFGLGVVHQSSQFATISNAVVLPAFTRIDAAVFFDVTDRFAVQFNVENLTDVGYYPSAHTDNNIATGKPLNARMTARLKF
ncbi:TonB-dependent receptor [Novosphingobium sp.]|uniref:TonB-dependent receptor n=1 Tax=Novosphingobium sp. TaxID=1874826 RepID=UPI0038F65A0E